MPGGDKTGPRGMGPMTGRAAGYCTGAGAPGYANPGGGRGFGMGMGRGRGMGRGGFGFRHRFFATGVPGWQRAGQFGGAPVNPVPVEYPDAGTEKQELKLQAETLQSQLDFINKRLDALETGEAGE